MSNPSIQIINNCGKVEFMTTEMINMANGGYGFGRASNGFDTRGAAMSIPSIDISGNCGTVKLVCAKSVNIDNGFQNGAGPSGGSNPNLNIRNNLGQVTIVFANQIHVHQNVEPSSSHRGKVRNQFMITDGNENRIGAKRTVQGSSSGIQNSRPVKQVRTNYGVINGVQENRETTPGSIRVGVSTIRNNTDLLDTAFHEYSSRK